MSPRTSIRPLEIPHGAVLPALKKLVRLNDGAPPSLQWPLSSPVGLRYKTFVHKCDGGLTLWRFATDTDAGWNRQGVVASVDLDLVETGRGTQRVTVRETPIQLTAGVMLRYVGADAATWAFIAPALAFVLAPITGVVMAAVYLPHLRRIAQSGRDETSALLGIVGRALTPLGRDTEHAPFRCLGAYDIGDELGQAEPLGPDPQRQRLSICGSINAT